MSCRTSLFWILMALVLVELRADPTHLKPNDPLNAHGTVPESKALWQELVKLRTAQEGLMAKIIADSIKPTNENLQYGDGYMRAAQMDRIVARLQIYGEPALVDVTAYNAFSRHVIFDGQQKFLQTPQGGKHLANVGAYLAKTAPQRQKRLIQLTQLVNKQQWVQAEKLLDESFQEYDRYTAYIGPHGRVPIYSPFDAVVTAIGQRMMQVRAPQALGAKEQTFKQVLGQKDELLRKIQAAATQLPQGGTVDVEGQALDGPSALSSFARTWGEVHAGLMKCAAVDYGIKGSTDEYSHSGSGSDDSPEMNRWQTECQKLADGMRQGFVNLLTAEANAAPPPIARKRYIEYIQAIGALEQRCSNPNWMDALAPALKQLATKGQIQESVDAYHAATHGLLRWRAKVSVAQTQAMAKDFPTLGTEFRKRVTAHDDVPGFFNQEYHRPYMTTYLSKLLPVATEQMIKVKVSAPNVVRFDMKEPIYMTRFDDGVYARLPSKLRAESGITGLMNDLLVDSTYPALTLEAAGAVITAQRGEFTTIGGEIAGIEVGASVTRFATLPPIAGNLLPYDQIQPSWAKVGDLSGLAVQFAVMPEWAAHKYFFTKVAVAQEPVPAPKANEGTKGPPTAP